MIRPRGDAWDTLSTADGPALAGLLGGKDRLLREAAVVFLAEKGKSVEPVLIAALRSGNLLARSVAADLLAKRRGDIGEKGITALAAALDDDTESTVRLRVATALSALAKSAEPAVPALIAAAYDPAFPEAAAAAASALGAIGDGRAEVIALFMELLSREGTGDNDIAGITYAVAALAKKPQAPCLLSCDGCRERVAIKSTICHPRCGESGLLRSPQFPRY